MNCSHPIWCKFNGQFYCGKCNQLMITPQCCDFPAYYQINDGFANFYCSNYNCDFSFSVRFLDDLEKRLS